MSPDKQLIVRETNDYAFDNPYFKDDETDTATQDAAEKGEAGFHVDNGDATHAQNAKASNGTSGQKKNRPFSSLPFHAVFHPSGKKQKATMDDTYISKHLERITVPLRGHDFTGLGFNICGNMRDGIFVKDVLHRGPASESGKIKAGDRIVGVTVSFGAMVYEDALTILSYASPYDVKLEIEKSSSSSSVARAVHLPSSSPKRLGASTSFRSGGQRRLFHPLYRSQSIDDLTQIGKDSFLGGNSSGSQRDSTSSATPKRSQSVEASNGGMKNRSTYALKNADEVASKSLSSNKGSRKSSTSSCESTGKTVTTPPPEKIQAPPKEEPVPIQKETKSSRFRVEQIHVKSEAPSLQPKHQPPTKPAREVIEDKQVKQTDAADEDKSLDTSKEAPSDENVVTISTEEVITTSEVDTEGEKPTAPPRKTSTPAKRRAPAPPPVPPTKNETSVVVHRVDDQQQQLPETEKIAFESSQKESNASELAPASDLPDFIPPSKVSDQKVESSINSAHVNGRNSPQKEEQSSPGKRKASSLGDLTKLDHGANKKASISAILERAVSLDLQQTMPGENLIKQKKILRAPTFEDDYDEDHESDLNDTDGNGLKRWDDGLDKVFVGLTNGDTKPNGGIEQDSDMKNGFETESSVNKAISDMTELSASTTNKVKKLLTVDIDFDSSSSENMSQDAPDSEAQLTSTPAQKTTEVKNFLEDDDSLDDVPYLASAAPQNDEEKSNKHSARTSSTSIPVFSPVTISIPVIKPDLTHYEKLPSPPPASTHPGLDQNLRTSKTTISSATEDTSKSTLEKISVQSLYRPIFTNKEISTPDLDTNPEKLLNGIDSDSSEHYTAQENTTVENTSSTESNSTSSLTVTLSPVVANNIAVKAPNNVAGFAKTLIIPGPNDVESLLSLAAEPNTPPPNLVQPPKSIENQ
ncbi:serine/arginine repetitive matrix protein 2-like [Stegodyphus dumicola]|uniref:serine/arginine repetitive matrix protein 2-like n=1 Tax=Stegodyphus dumicola TaxID=202533 RepID=UPI0015B0679F|nr:serine/arginine repetitive matrix protein 2-like [Stegodyphus dumicola]